MVVPFEGQGTYLPPSKSGSLVCTWMKVRLQMTWVLKPIGSSLTSMTLLKSLPIHLLIHRYVHPEVTQSLPSQGSGFSPEQNVSLFPKQSFPCLFSNDLLYTVLDFNLIPLKSYTWQRLEITLPVESNQNKPWPWIELTYQCNALLQSQQLHLQWLKDRLPSSLSASCSWNPSGKLRSLFV